MINFTPFPNLTTERLVLRQLSEADLDQFFILKSDERLLKNYDAKPKTYEEARRKLQELIRDIAANRSITWAITLQGRDRLIGSICYWNISPEESKAEIGYELLADWQGRGIMQEAVAAVIEYGFHGMKLQRIEAVPNPGHAKSIKLLERNHFIRGAEFAETDPATGRTLPRVMYTLRRSGNSATETSAAVAQNGHSVTE
ncbi:ribosomal-protein-alanine N-acetyltransferase [Hydrogenispora ethanolica]|uniref:Ribosomal-protein-alanine N-acetyltransferase n=1 Tax=Hydrogenispora ethanolica TaxID=1082276 RepID=A0A4R1QLS4_HYDET|nr:GNAT family N-acetyltransferase [Hydrogenispora ethanolica]TCL54659.1 ribosomal-protein-alanine N-acetyltransferase [Hydrogenispora ethanolica]